MPFFKKSVQKPLRYLFVLMVQIFIYHWPSGTLRMSEKIKKGQQCIAMVVKAKTKVNIFFMFLGSFDVNFILISLFLSFKALKAKKAANLARNTKLDRWMDIFQKIIF